MLELDVTHLIREADAFEFSASIAERGKNAGPETWANAKAEAKRKRLLKTPEDVQAARDYFACFGAWSRTELRAMSAQEINALTIQYVSGDIREAEALCPSVDNEDGIDWEAYERLAHEGTLSGGLYPHHGRVFYTLSN